MAFYAPPVSEAEKLLKEVTARLDELEVERGQIQKLKDEYLSKLEKASGLSREDAKEQLLAQAQTYYSADLAKIIETTRQDYQSRADDLARDILVDAMLHGATEYTAEYTVSTITLPNEAV